MLHISAHASMHASSQPQEMVVCTVGSGMQLLNTANRPVHSAPGQRPQPCQHVRLLKPGALSLHAPCPPAAMDAFKSCQVACWWFVIGFVVEQRLA